MLRRATAWLLMTLLILAFCLAGTVNAAASESPSGYPSGAVTGVVAAAAGDQPIAIAGLQNVLVYPPNLAVQEKGSEVSQSNAIWISDNYQLNRTVSDVETLLTEFAAYPNVQKVLQNVKIYVFPISVFPAGVLGEPLPFSGVTVSGDEIWVGVDAKYVLPHELGHMLHYKLLGADGYDWTNINAEGKAYLALKNYPSAYKLDAASQAALPWNARIAEMFAEDMKAYFLYNHDTVWKNDHSALDSNTTQYFDELLSGKDIEIPDVGTPMSNIG